MIKNIVFDMGNVLICFDPEKTLHYALAAGIAAISHERTIHPGMCVSLIEKIWKEYQL